MYRTCTINLTRCQHSLITKLRLGILPIKGTHTVNLSSSLYIIIQKPMKHRTNFHCITTGILNDIFS